MMQVIDPLEGKKIVRRKMRIFRRVVTRMRLRRSMMRMRRQVILRVMMMKMRMRDQRRRSRLSSRPFFLPVLG